jgi:hypothetical protein
LEEFHITVNKEENDEEIIRNQLKNRNNFENAIKDFNILKARFDIRLNYEILNCIYI